MARESVSEKMGTGFSSSETLRESEVLADQLKQRDLKYRKIPKVSPGAYIFQRPFLRGLFVERLIFGGAYLQREICVSKSIRLAVQLEVNLPFLLCFTLHLRAIFQIQAPGWGGGGTYIWRGDLTEGFCVTGLGDLYLDGLIFGILRYLETFCRLILICVFDAWR